MYDYLKITCYVLKFAQKYIKRTPEALSATGVLNDYYIMLSELKSLTDYSKSFNKTINLWLNAKASSTAFAIFEVIDSDEVDIAFKVMLLKDL